MCEVLLFDLIILFQNLAADLNQQNCKGSCILTAHEAHHSSIMVKMGGDQPGCLADRLLTGLGQP